MSLSEDIDNLLVKEEEEEETSLEERLLKMRRELAAFSEKAIVREVNCRRCDRPFRTIDGVDYCTRGCELGGWPEGHKK